MFHTIEETGSWPSALTVGIISLISKGEGTSPLKLRPVGVMSCVYRLWAATRVGEVLAWQECWLDKSLHGFRRSHGADDVWWEQALSIEHALLKCEDLFGLSLVRIISSYHVLKFSILGIFPPGIKKLSLTHLKSYLVHILSAVMYLIVHVASVGSSPRTSVLVFYKAREVFG